MTEKELCTLFANNLRIRRIFAALSKKELEKLAHIAPGSVSAYESGNKMPSYRTIKRLSDFFGIEPSELFQPARIMIGGDEA